MQPEFRPIVIGNPNQPRGNVGGATERDEYGRALFAITCLVAQGDQHIGKRPRLGADVFPNPLVKTLGLLPGMRIGLHQRLRQILHHFVANLNAGAIAEIALGEVLGKVCVAGN